MDLHLSGKLEQFFSKRHFGYIWTLRFCRLFEKLGSLGFPWAVTFVGSGESLLLDLGKSLFMEKSH
jgi:hypothetical protein